MPTKKLKKKSKKVAKLAPRERCGKCDDIGTVMRVALICVHESVIGQVARPPMPRLDFSICPCPAGEAVIKDRRFSIQLVTAGTL